MRIGCDHSTSPTTQNTRSRANATTAASEAFADTLASAVDATASEVDESRPPELSAATYRLFAAIDLERGDTEHAQGFLDRVPYSREAGLPLHRAGALSETGRWDYTPAAAALPETGIFDTASGQGLPDFLPYNTGETPSAGDCAGEVASTDAATEATGRTGNGRRIAEPDLAELLDVRSA